MKKTVGALVLTLSSLVISTGCASSRGASKPKPADLSGETYAMTRQTVRSSAPAGAPAIRTARIASR